jgi:hypothetical protein
VPAKSIYHDVVVRALIADGWKITDDPLWLTYGGRELYVDLGAERNLLAAEKNQQKIAIEIQSFVGRSAVRDLEAAVGQYNVYRSILKDKQSPHVLYMAVSQEAYEGVFSERLGQLIISSLQLRLIVFDDEQERIVQWIG